MTQEQPARNNIFGTVLTMIAPSSNYRGDSEGGNITPLQTLRLPDGIHTIFSAEAIRSKLREVHRNEDFPCNRSRLKDQKQPSVEYKKYPNPWEFADDKLFGFLALNKNNERKKVNADLEKAQKGKDGKVDQSKVKELQRRLALLEEYPGFQGDSVIRINYAVSLTTFEDYNLTMHQSPMIEGGAFKNAEGSALIHREVHVTAYQYPFGLNLNDLQVPYVSKLPSDKKRADLEASYKKWTATLLRGISELNGVGGNHARTMFSHAPDSVVIRLTTRRTPDFDLYGFKSEPEKSQRELMEALEDELTTSSEKKRKYRMPGEEIYIGGRFAREHPKLRRRLYESEEEQSVLNENLRNVNVFKTPLEAINAVVRDAGLEEA
jgi:CRISPR-associated protein Cst2